VANKLISLEGAEEVQTFLSRLPEEMFKEVKPEFIKAGLAVQSEMITRTTTGPLYRRTSDLSKSFIPYTKGTKLDNIMSGVYTKSPYAPIHEYGGTVRAKNAYKGVPGGPYLNIPSKFNKTGKGVMRSDAKSVFQQGGYIVKLKNPKKAKYMVMLKGKPMFWLVKEIKIRAQLGMEDTVEEEIPTLLSNLSKAIDEAMYNA